MITLPIIVLVFKNVYDIHSTQPAHFDNNVKNTIRDSHKHLLRKMPVADPGFSLGGRGVPTPKVDVLTYFFAENCMKMKEFVPRGCDPGAPSPWIRQRMLFCV